LACDGNATTAVVLVNGFNGLGLHTLLGGTEGCMTFVSVR
jgi:hypothetical protein